MTAHVARARRQRGKGLRSRAAKRRKQDLTRPDRPTAPTEYLT